MKKIIALLLALVMVLGLAACSGTSSNETDGTENSPSVENTSGGDTNASGDTINIVIWCAENLVSLTETQLNNYISEYGVTGVTFTVEAVSEADAATNMITDVEAGADIYCFAQDQLARLVQAGALMAVSDDVIDDVTSRNDGGSVAAGTVSDTLYAYPLTSDNGYFVYYDTSKLSEDDFADQTTLIEAVKAAGGTIAFELTDSVWYSAAYFFATGCESTWTADDSGAFVSRVDTFNSAAGIIACKGMAELINSGVMVNSSSADALSNGSIVLVDGTWDYETAKTILGDNLGCTKLWSFTVDGTSYQLGSYSGNKLIGVKPQTDTTKALWCQSVANYLSGEQCQMERFEALSWGPSNLNCQASDEAQANPGLAALAAQNNYATPQGQYPNSWWDVGKAIGASIQELGTTSPSDADLQAILDTYDAGLDDILAVEASSVDGWMVVGDLTEASWDVTYADYVFEGSDSVTGTFEMDIEIASVDWDSGFRVVWYNTWAASTYHDNGIGYSNLTSTDGFAEGSDNNILLDPGSYHVVLVVTDTEATITVTAN